MRPSRSPCRPCALEATIITAWAHKPTDPQEGLFGRDNTRLTYHPSCPLLRTCTTTAATAPMGRTVIAPLQGGVQQATSTLGQCLCPPPTARWFCSAPAAVIKCRQQYQRSSQACGALDPLLPRHRLSGGTKSTSMARRRAATSKVPGRGRRRRTREARRRTTRRACMTRWNPRSGGLLSLASYGTSFATSRCLRSSCTMKGYGSADALGHGGADVLLDGRANALLYGRADVLLYGRADSCSCMGGLMCTCMGVLTL
mmetsp:Transcript_12920/g.29729  ORF Transcript_12920/g.29729 Transcript_12920/m.29729 type:complete len:257 (+) Transcript_12920:3541-4311(+)